MRGLGSVVFLTWLACYGIYLWHANAGRWRSAHRFLDITVVAMAVGAILSLSCGSMIAAIFNTGMLIYVLRRYPRTDGRAWLERTMPGVARTIFWGGAAPTRTSSCGGGPCARPRGRDW